MYSVEGETCLQNECAPIVSWETFNSIFIVIPCADQAAGIKLVGGPQPKPLHRFSPNFQEMFTPTASRAD